MKFGIYLPSAFGFPLGMTINHGINDVKGTNCTINCLKTECPKQFAVYAWKQIVCLPHGSNILCAWVFILFMIMSRICLRDVLFEAAQSQPEKPENPYCNVYS